MKTILDVLNGSTDYLEKRNIESARLNAEHLLAYVLKLKRLELYLEFERRLYEDELAAMRQLLKERGNGRPLQHLLGTAEFCGREFLSDTRALIPRPETEQFVEIFLQKNRTVTSVLEIGSGSGVIPITLALELPEAAIASIDISQDALALAQANAEKLGVRARIQFHHGDLFPEGSNTYDAIIANLPYIPTDEIPTLSTEVRHDPSTALDGGKDGTDILRRLISHAPARLASGGCLYLEIGLEQAEPLANLLREEKYRDIEVHTDYQGHQRFLSAKHG